ncbi:MAG TPA: hypothetical protein VIM30_15625 [Candidatus Limnocylindrales bacterium]|jgi:hypothetical protein
MHASPLIRLQGRLLVSLAVVSLLSVTVGGAVNAAAPGDNGAGGTGGSGFDARSYLASHGYLPLQGVEAFEAAKAHANAIAQSNAGQGGPGGSGGSSTTGWQGVASSNVSPPDANGAIGPSTYVEVVNSQIAIYTRAGSLVASANLSTLTGHSKDSDPMVLWDPDTQRFYYNVWNTSDATMDWGFSKTANPTTIPGGFCSYNTSFGYDPTSFPDYPKLGQTKDYLLIGVNFYPSSSSSAATEADLLWISKPQGQGSISTCPPAPSGSTDHGKSSLGNLPAQPVFTPVPAIQTDPSSTGYVVTMSDIECPPYCGAATTLSVFTINPGAVGPVVTGPTSITVGSYTSPPDAPQPGTANTLDTLDGRITHAVSGVDPSITNSPTTVWVSHTVAGGAGSQVNWYEVDPTAAGLPRVGVVSNLSLYVLNAGVSNNRACSTTGCSRGDSAVVGFTTSSSTAYPAIQYVTSRSPTSFVMVKQSSKSDKGFTCFSGPCRWGDYGGATPDPAPVSSGGSVWLTNQWTSGGSILSSGDRTWNWEVRF